MDQHHFDNRDLGALRTRAEEKLRTQLSNQRGVPSGDQSTETLHELRVHRIELEMQGEELRCSQVALEASRARYFDLYDRAPAGYVTLDEAGVIQEANLTAATLLGAARSTLLGCPLARFIARDGVAQNEFYLHRKQLYASDEKGACELQMIRHDRTPVWVRLESTLAEPRDGEKRVSRHVIIDITDRREAEEEREKLRDELAQSQKIESLGRLAGGVAHDFNNMLFVILANVEAVLSDLGSAGPRDVHLTGIRDAAQRSADLTAQLLAYARKQPMRPELLDVNPAIDAALALVKRLIGENIELTWLPGAATWPIRFDPSQLDQVLTNLCLNARDAITGVGTIQIATENVTLSEAYCEAHADATPGEYVMLEVRDNGTGVDPEVMEHLFEPFFTTKCLGQGTGLGLATVYGIARQNGGFITASSRLGAGATFRVYLPRSVGEPTESLREGPADEQKETAHATVLLVEDEPMVAAVCRRMLEEMGYTVLAAASPSEALRQARDHVGKIDLLLTDLLLPEMSGRVLAQHLLVLHPQLRRLFMSGYPAVVISAAGVVEDGLDLVQKPFGRDELASRVRKALATN